MIVCQNVDRLLIQLCKITIIHYLSLVIGIRVQGLEIPLLRHLCQLKDLIFHPIGIIYHAIMREVYVNYLYLITVVRGEMTTIIQKDEWISFFLEYELINVEVNPLGSL